MIGNTRTNADGDNYRDADYQINAMWSTNQMMPSDLNGWSGLFVGLGFLAIGIGYFSSPRFVEWMLNSDRQGQRWVRLLGRDNARVVIRYIGSLVLISIGLWIVLISVGVVHW
jgi:hypothetical protein